MRWHRNYTLTLYAVLATASLLAFWPLSDDSARFRQGIDAAEKGDFKATYALWKPLAEKGYPRAQYGLGVLYDRGQGVAQDLSLAAEWYRKAAKENIWEAQINLGLLYIAGTGVTQDYALAADWFRKAADLGIADAQVNLGNLYRQGWGVEPDLVEAERWFRRAAVQGHPLGQYLLAEQLEAGVPPDFVNAYFWATIASDRGTNVTDQANALRARIRPQLTEHEQMDIEQRVANWQPQR